MSGRPALRADREQLARFIAALFRNADPESLVSFRAFADGGQHTPPIFTESVRLDAPDLVDRVVAMSERAARADRPAVFAPPIATFSHDWRARQTDLANGLTLTTECDRHPNFARAKLTAVLGPPTIVVESGGRWLNPETGELEPKVHLHWRLRVPTRTDREHADLRALRALACYLVGADPTCISIVHPIRWPGSVHRKGEPRLARIVEENDTELDLREALALLRALEPDAFACRPAPALHTVNPAKTAASSDVAAALAAIPNADETWADWNRVGMAVWVATEGDPHEGFDAFDAWSAKSAKYDPVATEERWNHFPTSPPTRIGAGSLFRLARKFDPAWIKPSERFDVGKWFAPPEEPLFPIESGDAAVARQGPFDRFMLEDFDAVADQALAGPPAFLVKGLLDLAAMSVVYGDSNAGKTFVVMDLEHHIATGRPYAGRRVLEGHVLHIFAEGRHGARKRIEALRRKYGSAPKFHVMFTAVDLFDAEADLYPLLTALRALPFKLVLIVIDTLARAMAGGDENSSKDMGTFVRNVDKLRAGSEAHVTLVHHSGKDASRGARGSSSLRAATDTEIEVTPGQVSVTKQRDLDKKWSASFALEPVEIGRDADGDPVTSCTVTLSVEREAEEATHARQVSAAIALLRAVRAEPKASQRRFSLLASVPKTTVTRLLKQLTKERLLVHTLDRWELTVKGEKALQNAT